MNHNTHSATTKLLIHLQPIHLIKFKYSHALLFLKRAHRLVAGPRLLLALSRAVDTGMARAPLQLHNLHSAHIACVPGRIPTGPPPLHLVGQLIHTANPFGPASSLGLIGGSLVLVVVGQCTGIRCRWSKGEPV